MLASNRCTVACLCSLVTAILSSCSGGTTYEHATSVAQNGDYEKAIELFDELAKTSDHPETYVSRGNCYVRLGNIDAGLADYREAIALIEARVPSGEDPLLPYVYYNRGIAYERAEKIRLAVADYEKAIDLQTDYPGVGNNLAWLLATSADESVRNPERAMELAASVLADAPDDAKVLDTVAACYASTGDFDQAKVTQEKAVLLCSEPAARQRFVDRLELYRNHKPFIDAKTTEPHNTSPNRGGSRP